MSNLSDRLFGDVGTKVTYYDDGELIRTDVTIAPVTLPVLLTEQENWLRGLNATTDQNPSINLLLKAATERVEIYLRRALLDQTVKDTFRLPATRVVLSRSDFSKLVDTDPIVRIVEGSPTVLTASDFYVEPGTPAVVRGKTGVLDSTSDAFLSVEYETGYGDIGDVPDSIRTGIMVWVAELFEARTETISGTIVAKLPNSLKVIIDPYRIRSI